MLTISFKESLSIDVFISVKRLASLRVNKAINVLMKLRLESQILVIYQIILWMFLRHLRFFIGTYN